MTDETETLRRINREHRNRMKTADDLMKFAAWYSTQSPFGWAAPICGTIQEAARLLRGEPEQKRDDGKAPGVLS